MGESYKLTYFNIKALAEPIRLIFAYAGVEYEDIRIEKVNWPPLKENYTWGQVPVLQVGDKTLCQSNAIARYLAKRYDLMGEDDWEAAIMDEFIDALVDIRDGYRRYLAEQDGTKKAELKKNWEDMALVTYADNAEAQIISNNGGPYMVGKKISWLDLELAHFLDSFEVHHPGILDSHPHLKKLRETVLEIPRIKEWVAKRPVTDV